MIGSLRRSTHFAQIETYISSATISSSANSLCYNPDEISVVRSSAEKTMAKRLKDIKEIKIERPPKAKLSAEESLKRTQEFDKRKEKFIASIRKGKG